MYWTTGEWTGKFFRLVPEIALDFYITNLSYVVNENESYFTYDAALPNSLTRFVIDSTGRLKQFIFGPGFPDWSEFWMRPSQPCEVYGFCGVFSICNELRTPICNCIKGFEPRVVKDWELGDHTDGCTRKSRLTCKNDTFLVVPHSRFPVGPKPLKHGSIEECELACLRNCSCTAYAFENNGCLVWTGELFNLKQLSANENTGKDCHVRIAATDKVVERVVDTRRKTKGKKFWVVFGSLGGFSIFLAIVLVSMWRREKVGAIEMDGGSLTVFKYRDLRNATKNFSEKLGEGGFGSVFRGTLPNSSGIAVKKLKSVKHEVKQEKQFRAEVSTIGLIQHVNLVRLRGFCVEGTKKFLVYDYMTNGSLEAHLFIQKDPINALLDWKTRYNIVVGTARGLAYLHEKCRDCIVHCDIKPDNILLDSEFSPKLADFGLAKLIGREFSRVLTTVKGTRGYLAPEWISGEAITSKADVFSYGMLLFEIISGRRNRDLFDDGEADDYFPIRVANRLNRKEEVLVLLDQRLEGNADIEEVSRACKIACWCIQDDEKDRPSMGNVVQALEGSLDVDIPPIPHFLQRLTGKSTGPVACEITSSG